MKQSIHKLPQDLINRIAAGEVVERPASIVKELVENALDAKASHISVEISSHTLDMRVVDNGTGMEREEVLMALERHATSKISAFEDLYQLSTFGFRGEALPSIAAVSKLVIRSQPRQSDRGTSVTVNHGVCGAIENFSMPFGSDISVSELFEKIPVRRKFLKSETSEFANIIQAFKKLVLTHPEVHFVLKRNGEELFHFPKTSEEERIWQFVSGEILRKSEAKESYQERRELLIFFSQKEKDILVRGYLGAPRLASPYGKHFYCFVNGRPVSDRKIRKALQVGYGTLLEKDVFPLAVLYLEITKDKVDVNVHPTKNEVRFEAEAEVFKTVLRAVSGCAQRAKWENKVGFAIPYSYADFPVREGRVFSVSEGQLDPIQGFWKEREAPLWEGNRDSSVLFSFSDLRVIGQVQERYIVCEGRENLVILDQHAAHERVLYEEIRSGWREDKRALRQLLLVPEVIDLSFDKYALYQENKSVFAEIGFDCEELSGNTIAVRSVPHVFLGKKVQKLFMELFSALGRGEGDALLNPLFATIACHSSFRFGDKLEMVEMHFLLDALQRVGGPKHCPHGRPIMVELPFVDLNRGLGRVS